MEPEQCECISCISKLTIFTRWMMAAAMLFATIILVSVCCGMYGIVNRDQLQYALLSAGILLTINHLMIYRYGKRYGIWKAMRSWGIYAFFTSIIVTNIFLIIMLVSIPPASQFPAQP